MTNVISSLINPLVAATTTVTTTTTGDAGALMGALAGMAITISLISIAVAVVGIVGMYNIFKKCGVEGWKAIIPFYNLYIEFKLFWETKFFIFFLICIPLFACGIGAIGALIICIMLYNYQRKSFGYDVGFLFGLIFLSPIFLCINGFDKSQYLGNAYLKEHPEKANGDNNFGQPQQQVNNNTFNQQPVNNVGQPQQAPQGNNAGQPQQPPVNTGMPQQNNMNQGQSVPQQNNGQGNNQPPFYN